MGIKTDKEKGICYEWVFALDVTFSMNPEMNLLLSSLDGCVAHLQKLQVSVRMGLVAYREYGETQGTQFADGIVDVVDLGPPDRVREALARLSAQGGGDLPEPAEKALEVACTLDWTPPNANGVRIRNGEIVQCGLVVITDAPPHGLGDLSDKYPQVDTDFVKQVDTLALMGIPCHTLGVRDFQQSHVAAGAYQLAASRTNGRLVRMENLFCTANDMNAKRQQLVKFFCNTILIEIEMEKIVAELESMELPDKSPAVIGQIAVDMLAARTREMGIDSLDGDEVCYRSLGGFVDEAFVSVRSASDFSKQVAKTGVKALSADAETSYRACGASLVDASPTFRSLGAVHEDVDLDEDDTAVYRAVHEDVDLAYAPLAADEDDTARKQHTEPAFQTHTNAQRIRARVARWLKV
jgi:hypothetical protein